MKKIILFLVTVLTATSTAWAQGALGQIPKKVDYRDARITNVGVVAADIYHWTVEDPETHKIDTIYQADPYILWESDGDLDQQAEERRARGLDIKMAPGVITEKGQKGNLKWYF